MKPLAAFGLGAAVGGLIAGVAAYRKKKALTQKGLLLTQSLTGGGNELEAYLATRGSALQDEIAQIGATKGASLARHTAETMLAREYGLTPQFEQQVADLDQRLQTLRSTYERLSFS